MSADLATYLGLLLGYLFVAGGLLFLVWCATRRVISSGLRLACRAFALAFLLAPGAVACGGASFTPFSLVVVVDVIGFISPNGCGPYTPLNLVSFLPALAIAALVLYFLERRRRRGAAP